MDTIDTDSADEVFLTEAGRKKLNEELDVLVNVTRR